MWHSSQVNAVLALRVTSACDDRRALTAETDHLHYRLAVLAASRRVKELRRRVIGQIIQDVPSDIAVCEFDCRKVQCTLREWEACEHRRRNTQRSEMQRT